jgi:hypothetical protein
LALYLFVGSRLNVSSLSLSSFKQERKNKKKFTVAHTLRCKTGHAFTLLFADLSRILLLGRKKQKMPAGFPVHLFGAKACRGPGGKHGAASLRLGALLRDGGPGEADVS